MTDSDLANLFNSVFGTADDYGEYGGPKNRNMGSFFG